MYTKETLKKILKTLGCNDDGLLKHPRKDARGDIHYFTQQGAAAYGRLTELIEDLGDLGVLGVDTQDVIETLDELVREA